MSSSLSPTSASPAADDDNSSNRDPRNSIYHHHHHDDPGINSEHHHHHSPVTLRKRKDVSSSSSSPVMTKKKCQSQLPDGSFLVMQQDDGEEMIEEVDHPHNNNNNMDMVVVEMLEAGSSSQTTTPPPSTTAEDNKKQSSSSSTVKNATESSSSLLAAAAPPSPRGSDSNDHDDMDDTGGMCIHRPMMTDRIPPITLNPTVASNFDHFLFYLLAHKARWNTYHINKDENPPLHAWLQWIKREYKTYSKNDNTTNCFFSNSQLTALQVSVLEYLHVPLTSRGDEHWNRFYELLLQYRKVHGHVLVPRLCEIPGLGDWVTDQRRQYKALKQGLISQLSKERMERLEAIGFTWQVRNRPEWEQRFSELLQYKEKHGDCKVPQHFRENRPLGKWVAKQREQYKLHKRGEHSFLTPYRLEKLNKVGFLWQVRSGFDDDDDDDNDNDGGNGSEVGGRGDRNDKNQNNDLVAANSKQVDNQDGGIPNLTSQKQEQRESASIKVQTLPINQFACSSANSHNNIVAMDCTKHKAVTTMDYAATVVHPAVVSVAVMDPTRAFVVEHKPE